MQLVFAVTLFLSATLLFLVQPMFARMVLPLLGGTPAVWNTCMVFYQAALLAGYVYAHLSVKWLGPRRQAALHLALMLVPWLVLPIGVAQGWTRPGDANPVPWLLVLLTVSVGLPFLVVSASAPMLQAWFAATGHRSARDPYFLYAASNLGSMLALIGYPLVVEPGLTLRQQSQLWVTGYALLMLWIGGCAALLWKSGWAAGLAKTPDPLLPAQVPGLNGAGPAPLTWSARLRWLALAMIPSSLLLGVTTFLATDIASIPLLWVIPLALYLLTFVLVFSQWQILPYRWLLWPQAFLTVLVTAAFFVADWHTAPIAIVFPIHLLLFFLTAMVCHGELAATRQAPEHLTEFYLWISVGGVLGGLFNALAAPLLFTIILEYPVALAAACLLRPWPEKAKRSWFRLAMDLTVPLAVGVIFGVLAKWLPPQDWQYPTAWWPSAEDWEEITWSPVVAQTAFLGVAGLIVLATAWRPIRLGLGMAALLAVSFLLSGEELKPLYRERSFFGVLEVKVRGKGRKETHELVHGSTLHGTQSTDKKKRHDPWTYYYRSGPVGDIFEALEETPKFAEIGVVGLGTGTVAAYGQPGQRVTYFEIDPAIVRIARNPDYFTYLSDCKADVDVILGDARLSLADLGDRQFNVLLIDAFSSDAIPIHLLTREAIELYLSRLAPHGLLAVHISNRFLDLEPVLGNLAEDLDIAARVCEDSKEKEEGKSSSTWVVIAKEEDDLGLSLTSPLRWEKLRTDPKVGLWTDDYSNVVGVLQWDSGWYHLPEWLTPRWWRQSEE